MLPQCSSSENFLFCPVGVGGIENLKGLSFEEVKKLEELLPVL